MKHALLILALGLSIQEAGSFEIELAAGRSELCCVQDGVWWQSDFGFNGHVRTTTLEIGARQRFGNWSIHGAYIDLGTATGFNVATMRDDDFGSFNRTKRCDPDSQKNCLGYFATSQNTTGVLLGVAYGLTFKGVLVEGEAGQFFYQSDMRVSILCPNCGLATRYAFGAGGTFSSASEIRRSPYGALRVSYKGLTLTYRRITHVDGNGERIDGIEAQFATGLTNGPVNQVLVGVSI